jgi:hypothetical protein
MKFFANFSKNLKFNGHFKAFLEHCGFLHRMKFFANFSKNYKFNGHFKAFLEHCGFFEKLTNPPFYRKIC